ncbi:MAG: RNA 2',3'-cyclic phosphodiesterase [Candidatus Hydrothermarchaeaceae archaeon]
MRSFIAVGITTPEVLNLLEELRKIEADIKVVKPENLHLTLKFLGEITEGRVDEIHKALTDCLSLFRAFDVSLKGVGAFPKPRRMRVIWIGFDKNGERFVEMNDSIGGALESIGFRREGRFHPHLTLARVRTPRGKEELISFIKKHETTPFGGSRIESVELRRSTLTPRGPIYSTLRRVNLRD